MHDFESPSEKLLKESLALARNGCIFLKELRFNVEEGGIEKVPNWEVYIGVERW